ncbi:MAG: SMR family transporter [Solirubrobacterales bacterium]
MYLAAAIATEVVGTVFLRFTDGFTRPAPSILVGAHLRGLALGTN